MKILGLGILLLATYCVARELPSYLEKRHNYETVYPRVVKSSRDARSATDGEELTVTVTTSNETLTLHLKLNEKLISPNFISTYYDETGREIISKGHSNCYYHGVVEEHPTWMVVISTCGGLNGFFGDINNKSQYFHLKPVSDSNPSLEEAHMLIPDSEYSTEEMGTCGTAGHNDADSVIDDQQSLSSDIERVRRQSPSGDYIVEMAIVNDNRQYVAYGRDISRTVRRALDVVNAADAIYRGQNVRLVVVHAITWTNGDRVTVDANPNTYLTNFRNFKGQISNPHDAVMLFTGLDLNGNTVGIAYLNAMCGSFAVGLVQDGTHSVSSSGSTFAHELGHIFSLEHDENGCTCNDRSGRCVMAAVSGFPAPERWSSCSVSQLNTALTRATNNLGRCLENEPTTTVGDPVCGNGIREGDEVCDCGTAQECNDPCCDAATCQPTASAQCTKGECCTSTCQFKDYGTSCRSASGQCDVEEYCSGQSSECPADVYHQDGTSCNNNQAYCYSGECQTYNAQCQYHFATDMGVSNCYTSYNTRGDVFGNCGYTATDYIACSQSNTMCGQLFCNVGQFQNRVRGGGLSIVTVGVIVNNQRRDCNGFTTEPGTDMISPGLVNDGTKCRDGHLCYEQRCIPVGDLNVAQCQVINGQICSGNGICNNNGQCSCNVGYIGAACETQSNGPSVDECSAGTDNCDQGCVDTEESFYCTCNDGFRLSSDGHSCIRDCGGIFTTATGSFQTPGWPNNYPQEDFQCEWTIRLPNTEATIEFTIDTSAYGIHGRPPCPTDYIEFFDGTENNANSLHKLCRFENPGLITTSASQARVVFAGTANSRRTASRVGVKVDYKTINPIVEENECDTDNGGCQQICTDTASSFECSCREGYQLDQDGRSCNDIDECSENTDNCQQVCSNTDGSFTCSCNEGFTLEPNGRSCTAAPVSCGGTLSESSGSFQTPGWPNNYPQENFQCEWTIALPNTNSRIEFTIDDSAYGINGRSPCSTDYIEFFDGTESNAASLHKLCRFDNPGSIVTTSSRARVLFAGTINSNRPVSRVGVRVTFRTLQPEVNECNVNNGGCQQICSDTTSSFECSCREGYQLDQDGRSCNDIDECSENTHNCQQVCSNTDGSFTCSCNEGFILEPNGRSCTAAPVSCGGTLSESSGRFQTPGWPNNYPQENFQCEWTISLPNTNSRIEFTIDDSAYGINGRPPCNIDHIEFFDGTESNAASLHKLCKFENPGAFTTSTSQARVEFVGNINRHRPASRVGVKVDYRSV